MKPSLCIITPALAAARNGNWQTAVRWAAALRAANGPAVKVRVLSTWDGQPDQAMIALHARRSADSIEAYGAAGLGPIALVLTGTDLYRDIQSEPSAQASLRRADRLVVLQENGLATLPAALRRKATVIHQSAPRRAAKAKRHRTFDLALVGHWRAEKDPATALGAFQHLNPAAHAIFQRLRLRVVGNTGGLSALATQALSDPRIILRGPRTHAQSLNEIAQAQALLLPSLMEGGANVAIEAIQCRTPVLASAVSGNVGILGARHPGLFPVGDARALATLIDRLCSEPSFRLSILRSQNERAPLFAPALERTNVQALVRHMLREAQR